MAVNRAGLDLRAVGSGAALALAVAVPPVILVQALRGDDLPGQESNLWLITPVALLAGFAAGGFVAGRRHPATPLMHAAAAGASAFLLLALYSVVRRATGDGVSPSYVIRLLLLAQICVSVALLGGFVAGRAARLR